MELLAVRLIVTNPASYSSSVWYTVPMLEVFDKRDEESKWSFAYLLAWPSSTSSQTDLLPHCTLAVNLSYLCGFTVPLSHFDLVTSFWPVMINVD